ncbi:hypothetical protein BGZ76_001199 [Entomortierella beljakovae]|nr:hypothetical protein BGZ76_001199 [Entomortierella beljakovae]
MPRSEWIVLENATVKLHINEKVVEFQVEQNECSSGPSVCCPSCAKTISRNHARRHYIRFHTGTQEQEDVESIDLPEEVSQIDSTKGNKRKFHSDDAETDRDIFKNLCGDVPQSMLETTMKLMPANAYKLCRRGESEGDGVVLPLKAFHILRSIISPEYEIVPFSTKPEHLALKNDQLHSTHTTVSQEDLKDLRCYVQKSIIAIPWKICMLNLRRGRLKIVLIPDQFPKNKKLVLGVRGHNYLITSAIRGGNAFVGPGRCGEFPVNHTTKLYIRKEKQDQNLLNNDILGLAQIRSGFGQLTTYLPRRGALVGFGSIPLMPRTIFTLTQDGVKNCGVFRKLAIRARERMRMKISLHINDVDVPSDDDDSKAADVLRELIKLFSESQKIYITGNEKAEKLLSDLANEFSSKISDRNIQVAKAIISEVNGS